MQILLDGQAEGLAQKAIELALSGDIAALRLCLERLLPPRKDAPVAFEIPRIKGVKDAAEAAKGVVEALCAGALTPNEAVLVMASVERCGRLFQLAQLEDRIDAIERAVLGDNK